MSDSKSGASVGRLKEALGSITTDAEALHYCLTKFYFKPGEAGDISGDAASQYRFSLAEEATRRVLRRLKELLEAGIPKTEEEFRVTLAKFGVDVNCPGEDLDCFLKFLDYFRAVGETAEWFAEMRAGEARLHDNLGMRLFNGWGVFRPLLRASERTTPADCEAENHVTPDPVEAPQPQNTTTRVDAQSGDILIRGGNRGPDGPGHNVFIRGGDGGPDAPGGAVVIQAGSGRRAENPAPASVAVVSSHAVLPGKRFRFCQFGDRWIFTPYETEEAKVEGWRLIEFPDSLHRLHITVWNVLQYIQTAGQPYPEGCLNDWKDNPNPARTDMNRFVQDISLLFWLTDDGWRLIKDYSRILAKAAGSPVRSCETVGNSGHELVLRIADRVLRKIACPEFDVSYERYESLFKHREGCPIDSLKQYISGLRLDRVDETFQHVCSLTSFIKEEDFEYLERQLDFEFLRAGDPDHGKNTPTKSITKDEAEGVARRLDKEDMTFRHLTAKEMAARIQNESGKPCSESLVKNKLPFWHEAMTATGRGRKRGGAKGQGRKRGTAARPMNFSKEVEAVAGEGEKHEVLEELAEAEENAEAERALREQTQAIHLVESSRLKPEEQRQTIARLEAGKMTPQQAVNMVSLLEQDPKRNRKKTLSHD